MANDIMSTLKGLLGDDAEEKIQSVLRSLQESDTEPDAPVAEKAAPAEETQTASAQKPALDLESIEYILKIKSALDEAGNANDDRSNLLLSLRPYMREERQKGIDQAIRMLNLSKFSGLFRL